MNSLFSKSTFALINLAALAVCCSTMSAKAETGNLPDIATTANAAAQNIDQISSGAATSAVKADAETTASNTKIDSISSIELTPAAEPAASAPTANSEASAAAPAESTAATSEIAVPATEQNTPTSIAAETEKSEETAKIAEKSVENQQKSQIVAEKSDRPNSELTASKEEKEVKTTQEVLSNPVSTSASALTNQPKVAQKPETAEKPQILAQPGGTTVRPGRATRSGPSYIGIGGNIGFGGDSALGDTSFAILSKIGLTNNFSVRPSVLFRDNLTVIVPVTYDFVSREAVEVSDDFVITAAPYLGAGVAFSTGDDGNFGFLISGGVDVPLSSNFTATAGLNIGFLDGTDVGLLLGVGYTFPNVAR
ncbi:MAG: hypothetical protein JGK17_31730 [Microcoleus sp. PH2017_10_PVI_O_A]|uniref:outer membrane protein n=1 Tax=unclassified Microcoleus TaxID=2642155 RepID=UPI001D1EE703|nr:MULTISPECIES: hypothetical protein [unclassified Microcoleus]TAE86397.1 MAG: hypothetical protein EAZ83_00330 [Oscillatoriales cyanobacterium]MCC3410026.1 hypothetical protein [Microcoleus sp. PH2017_10_PVI_O_A]MCC3464294.1 hypothetical protein [Microcoleus sp. PH2017_11_PCY_U_A]MCC3482637.1 hypothetical protein [Microcoleus sp. PH2017_12_PCY_D_A]MCC3532462.1 hypothetical protein [Microcoleus sp. PH2017_21_RUC_O_A]